MTTLTKVEARIQALAGGWDTKLRDAADYWRKLDELSSFMMDIGFKTTTNLADGKVSFKGPKDLAEDKLESVIQYLDNLFGTKLSSQAATGRNSDLSEKWGEREVNFHRKGSLVFTGTIYLTVFQTPPNPQGLKGFRTDVTIYWGPRG